MKIIQKDVRIPDEVKFSCSNCGTIFSTRKFTISSIYKVTAETNTGVFSVFSSWYWQTRKDVFQLAHRCPRCTYWCSVEIDKGEPEYKEKVYVVNEL